MCFLSICRFNFFFLFIRTGHMGHFFCSTGFTQTFCICPHGVVEAGMVVVVGAGMVEVVRAGMVGVMAGCFSLHKDRCFIKSA